MKILGLFSGRTNGISEALCKQALLGARDEGAQVEAVNLRSLWLQPCTNCNACSDLFFGGSGSCVLRDDFPWLDEKLMECDGIVVVMPVFEKAPPGEFKILMDRTGPSHDVAFRYHSMEYRKEHNISEEEKKGPDQRSFKVRPAAFLAHGGSDWSSLALPMMETWAVPMGFTVGAKALFEWNVDLVFDESKLEQAYRIGAHIARSVGVPPRERSYLGEAGCCPFCHNDVMRMSEDFREVQCAVCGVKGRLEVQDGAVRAVFSRTELEHSHLTMQGRRDHCEDLQGNGLKTMKLGPEKLAQRKKELCQVLPTTTNRR